MKFPLFSQVILKEDIPEFSIKKGAVATIVEHYPMSDTEEDGYSLEGLINQDTVEVSESHIELYSSQDFVIDKESTIAL
ncbi:hypothetical protein Xen7305DRAFT_00030230 [Xenococcus sp. PCC 7305]|uniref:DUF4926 domain-containing protein n=1 Tax=Xenococcus sp. PCC 7305 TaxID=102125 RepID=UPI0002ACA626|nr:DUF4926 domain-containing protein [Xenococcus sp. PCC 7305]ELS03302.1 hypothetical protein Xen7305DRAFT_00030230 [Xenococcus sp. PCC 7305]